MYFCIPGSMEYRKIFLDQLVGRDFEDEEAAAVERQIISCIKRMDDKGKELSLGLVNQAAKHRGSRHVGK